MQRNPERLVTSPEVSIYMASWSHIPSPMGPGYETEPLHAAADLEGTPFL